MMKPPIPSRITSILGTYYLSTATDRITGRQWYLQAHTAALDLSDYYPASVITTAGVIAALSPNNRWNRNLLDADSLINCYFNNGGHAGDMIIDYQIKVSTYRSNLQKALKILKLDHPTVEDVAKVLNGRKVVAFYRCILGSQTTVCVDGHTYSVWAGERISTNKTPYIGPRLYDQIASDFIKAAALIGPQSPILHGPNNLYITPAQLQAVTWVTHKRIFSR